MVLKSGHYGCAPPPRERRYRSLRL